MSDIRTRTRNFWKFRKILVPLPGNDVTPVRLWHNTRGTGIPSLQYSGYGYTFVTIGYTFVTIPGVRVYLRYNTRGTGIPSLQYLGYGCTFATIPGERCIHSGLIQKMSYIFCIKLKCRHVLSVTQTEHRTQQAVRTYHAIRAPGCKQLLVLFSFLRARTNVLTEDTLEWNYSFFMNRI